MDALLRGYGQILFCNNPATGLLFFLVFLIDPARGLAGLVGAATATAAGMMLGASPLLLRSGLLSCNGALIGLSWVLFIGPSLLLALPLVAVSALSAVLLLALLGLFSVRWQLPVLSVPFVVVTWASFLDVGRVPGALPSWEVTPLLSAIADAEGLLCAALPEAVGLLFRVVSAVFFQDSVLVGLVCFLALLANSRLSALTAAAGAYLGAYLFLGFGDPAPGGAGELVAGFNSALVALALGAMFVRLSWRSTVFALLGAASGGIIAIAMDSALARLGLPALAAPFNLITLLFLAVVRSPLVNGPSRGLVPVPLVEVGTPQASPEWGWRRRQSSRLTLPFYGRWYVSQGNHSPLTHWGRGSYAWDFVVVDDGGRTYQGVGNRAEHYYAFSLPAVAPAPGRVVWVVDNVPDNVPPQVNEADNWGNLVIIDHGNGEFSELSHFRFKGIVVRAGEAVVRGQLLGHVGNSGRSMEPHLHYQLQRENRPGARTVAAKFSHYLRHDGAIATLLKSGVPQQGEQVSNPPS
ncbi:MAG: urea transporter [Chloroflexota bacterium]